MPQQHILSGKKGLKEEENSDPHQAGPSEPTQVMLSNSPSGIGHVGLQLSLCGSTQPHLDGDASVILLQVLEPDLQVQLPAPAGCAPRTLDDTAEKAQASAQH